MWHEVSAAGATSQLNGRFDELYRDLARGVPSIVCMRDDEQPENSGPAEVRAWAEGTARRTVRALAQMYYARPPERTLDVFLFEDSASQEGWLGGVKELMSTTDAQFYADDSGASYAQARYLMHYLQSRRLLKSYYRDFVASHRSDPTGYASLTRVLGRSPADMASFDRELNRYVLGLRYQ